MERGLPHKFRSASKRQKISAIAGLHLMAIGAFVMSGSSDPSGRRSLAETGGSGASWEWPTWSTTQHAFRRLCVHDERSSSYRRSLSLGVASKVIPSFLAGKSSRVERFLSCNVGFNCTFDEVTGYDHCYDGEAIDPVDVYTTYKKVPNTPPVAPNNIGYVTVIDKCPKSADDISAPLVDNNINYDTYAVCTTMLCNTTVSNEERLVATEGVTPTKYDYTAYAVLHPDAVACPDPNGGVVDMPTLLMDLGYWPKIWNEPIYPEDLVDSPYKATSLPEDVGFSDLVSLHAYRLTDHPLVVMVEPTTIFLDPVDEVYDTLLADPNAKASYVKGHDGMIDMGMLVIKPGVEEFEAIKDSYINTPYTPTTGWDGTNIGAGGPGSGGMGTKGFLTYYYEGSPSAPPTSELDRCTYGNRFENGECASKPIEQVKVARMDEDSACPPAWTCDDSNSNQLCSQLQTRWSKARKDFEDKAWTQTAFSDRTGMYNYERFQGYCDGNSKTAYHKMLEWNQQPPNNEAKLIWEGEYTREKEPKTVPYIAEEIFLDEKIIGCDKTDCGEGSYKLPDCTCSPDPCAACPEGTRCQNQEGLPLMCIDCTCGFCDYADRSCCESDATGHTCKATNVAGLGECKRESGFFPAFTGTGSVCSNFDIDHTITQKGCTCQPHRMDVCTYDKNDRTWAEQCHICSAQEIVPGPDGEFVAEPICSGCKTCLQGCANSACVGEAIKPESMQECMGDLADSCREGCYEACRKGYEAKVEVKEAKIAEAVSAGEPLPPSKPEATFTSGSPCEGNHCDVCDIHCTGVEDGIIKNTADGNIQCCIGEKACFEKQTYADALGGSGVDVLCCRGHQSCYKSFIDLPTSGVCCLASKDSDPNLGGGMVCQEAHFIRNQNSAFTGQIPIKCLNEKACYQTDFEGAGPVSLCCEEDGLDGVGANGPFIAEDTDTCYQLGNNEKTWGPIGGESSPPFESKNRFGPENGSKVHCASNTKGTSAKGKNCYQADFAEIAGTVDLCCAGGGNEDCKQVCDTAHGCTCSPVPAGDWCSVVTNPTIYGLDTDAWGEYDCDLTDNEG